MIEEVDFASDAPALVVEGPAGTISYRELGRRVEATRELLRMLPRPAVVFQFGGSGPAAVAAYLACLAERIPLGLGEPALAARDRVIAAYAPTAIILSAADSSPLSDYEFVRVVPGDDMALWIRRDRSPFPVKPHDGLALLLATSGSTGAAKFVRLSRDNLRANALSIAEYLTLGGGEVAAQSLPIHYSYGLSVLNSHLVAKGAVVLTSHSFMRPEFWRVVDECKCTSFAGVPYMYETLHRLRLLPSDRPSMRTLTQAGGHLRIDLVRHFGEAAAKKDRRLFVMYGQTEAAPRIAYVPPERLMEKLGSIGIAIPGGELSLKPVEGENALRQLCYRGPNVMLGYASTPADLTKGDEQGGELETGDLAECDPDGFYFVNGRLARFAKLFGKRINLADIEAEVERQFATRTAVVDGGDRLRVFLEGSDDKSADQVRTHLAGWLGVPPPAVVTVAIRSLPLTTSGKKDYRALA